MSTWKGISWMNFCITGKAKVGCIRRTVNNWPQCSTEFTSSLHWLMFKISVSSSPHIHVWESLPKWQLNWSSSEPIRLNVGEAAGFHWKEVSCHYFPRSRMMFWHRNSTYSSQFKPKKPICCLWTLKTKQSFHKQNFKSILHHHTTSKKVSLHIKAYNKLHLPTTQE